MGCVTPPSGIDDAKYKVMAKRLNLDSSYGDPHVFRLYSRDAIDQNRMPYRWHCTSVEDREKWREKARYAIKEWEEQDAK